MIDRSLDVSLHNVYTVRMVKLLSVSTKNYDLTCASSFNIQELGGKLRTHESVVLACTQICLN